MGAGKAGTLSSAGQVLLSWCGVRKFQYSGNYTLRFVAHTVFGESTNAWFEGARIQAQVSSLSAGGVSFPGLPFPWRLRPPLELAY